MDRRHLIVGPVIAAVILGILYLTLNRRCTLNDENPPQWEMYRGGDTALSDVVRACVVRKLPVVDDVVVERLVLFDTTGSPIPLTPQSVRSAPQTPDATILEYRIGGAGTAAVWRAVLYLVRTPVPLEIHFFDPGGERVACEEVSEGRVVMHMVTFDAPPPLRPFARFQPGEGRCVVSTGPLTGPDVPFVWLSAKRGWTTSGTCFSVRLQNKMAGIFRPDRVGPPGALSGGQRCP